MRKEKIINFIGNKNENYEMRSVLPWVSARWAESRARRFRRFRFFHAHSSR